MKADQDGISQHKDMAMGKSIEGQGAGKGDFGVQSIHDGNHVEHMDRNASGGHLADHERAAPHPHSTGNNRHTAQAQPDHGPHHMHTGGGGHFGGNHAPMPRGSNGRHHRGQNGGRGA